ncbi:MAG: methylmalonyl Co-A mutase-associated GTPase MeaB [Bacteroidetes bacterium]|nr:methylmalonyl Co-A mutase-associated GTPase MeaB [Bacteroidota bacterium]MBU1114252.1 methylmalonyl Co-A mutase-associated GTPase MeaB [Bacteroidota bacterium]MBU1797684.1 methylmalonyl Co-A mutase-associated GTPase MeaB [Bacteroidota bacterium]
MNFDLNKLGNLSIENKRLIARIISVVESEDELSIEILKELYKKTGAAFRIGITGPPGAGKSTITNQISKHFLALGKSVAIIAVDPTSPFSGGALLGDRVRMNDIGMLDKVYIRSVATRGSLGGLSKKTIDIADVFDASGFDYIIFETVGVGQSELDIAKIAHSTIVTLVPESGDSIQAMKAGLMEIADMFVLNKSDRPDADKAFISLQSSLQLRNFSIEDWQPPILKTSAISNIGITELVENIERHRLFCSNNINCAKKRSQYAKERVINIINDFFIKEVFKNNSSLLNNSIEKIINGNLSPYILAEQILRNYKSNFDNIKSNQ